MIALLVYLWAALTVGLVMWLQADYGTWRMRDLVLLSLGWPLGPVMYCVVKRGL